MEHFHTGNNGLLLLIGQTDDLNFIGNLNGTSLHSTRSHGAATGDGEDVLNRHQEGQVGLSVGSRNVLVNSFHELEDRSINGIVDVLGLGLESSSCRAADDRHIVAREAILVQQVTNFHLNQIKQFGVVNQVGLVHEHNDCRNFNLTSEQNVLAGLLQRTVGSSNNQDCAVHLCSTGDHVLDIVCVTGAVHVSIVTLLGLVLNMTGVDCDTSCLLFGSIVDLVICQKFNVVVGQSKSLGDSCGKSGLAVVNVTDGTNVNMGFRSFEFFLCHFLVLLKIICC